MDAPFRTIHQNLEAALTATGVNDASGETNASAARASAKSRFESTKQRFFNHLLMGMKAPTIIRAIEEDVAAGYACVIQVVSTGESLLKRRLEAMDPEDALVEGALTPRDYVLSYLEQAFPIHAQKLVEIEGNIVAEPLRDANGALVVSREALALRDAAMMELMSLAPIVTLMRKVTRPTGSSYLEETKFGASAWEEIDRDAFQRLWDEEAETLPKVTTTKLYLLTGLLLPIWKDIPSGNERIYRVTPEGQGSMIGRTVSEDGAAVLRARFMVGAPKTPGDILTAALGSIAPVDLGRGLTLIRRRVAGAARLEIDGADRGAIDGLKVLGCFTEVIAFQLRVFVPHGEGIDTAAILGRIVGAATANSSDRAA